MYEKLTFVEEYIIIFTGGFGISEARTLTPKAKGFE
jgi:hypothetical protein